MGEKRWNREDVLALDKEKWRTKIHHLFIKITPTPSRIGKRQSERRRKICKDDAIPEAEFWLEILLRPVFKPVNSSASGATDSGIAHWHS